MYGCSCVFMTRTGFMPLLPRGLAPDLLWLWERLDAASTFIGQIKLKLFPITPASTQLCTFMLINEAIPVINGSYYTRLDRTFSFYHTALSDWVKCVLILGWTNLSSSLCNAKPCLTLFTFRRNLNLLWSVASLNILTFCWSSLMQYLHQLTSLDSTPVKTDLSFVLMN